MVEIERRREPYRKFSQILLYTPPTQQNLWKAGFRDTISEIRTKDSTFLTLHAVYYHQDKREFISPIDFELVRQLKKKVRMLIVLIDDIYDICKRLMMSGQMYSRVLKLDKLEALYSSIINLISLLQWRELEIAVSRIISGILKIPMFLVATKHPVFLTARLVEAPLQDLKLFYLSHPISAIRKTADEMLPEFIGELNLFIKDLVEKCSDGVVFLPDTIDELRIKKQEDQYTPEFLPRWPPPWPSDQLVSPVLPTEVRDLNPLNPLKYHITSDDIKTSVSYLLRVLADYIDQQITSRDLTLVEQSKAGVVAYRPHLHGKLSGGVHRELEYNRKLWEEHAERQRASFILSTDEELSKWRIRTLLSRVKMYITLDDVSKGKVDQIQEEWLSSEEKLTLFSGPLLPHCSTIRGELQENVLPKNYQFQSAFIERLGTSLPPGQMGQEEKERQFGFDAICLETQEDELEQGIINQAQYRIYTHGEFIKRSRQFIEELCQHQNIRKGLNDG